MIDIICFRGEEFNLGFNKVYYLKDLNIIFGGSENLNRNAVENKKVDILVSPERNIREDNLHYRNSGLNQVLCKLAAKNKVAIGFSFSDILNSNERGKLLGRMMQNVRLCRKYKVKIVFASFARTKYEQRNAKDLMAFARAMGMNGNQANEALNFEKKKETGVKLLE